jgi:hypothetical protein
MSQINELKIQKDYIKGSLQVTCSRTTRPKRARGYHTVRDPCETKVKKHNGHNLKVKILYYQQCTKYTEPIPMGISYNTLMMELPVSQVEPETGRN